jgi:16S rRNA (cytosine1402-N4)-methyltransferase
LDPHPGDFIIDGTVDGGGHAREILGRITDTGTLLGTDWDETLLAECKERLAGYKNAVLVHANYADLPQILAPLAREGRIPSLQADGLLIDLGFSSEQLAKSGRGFSFGPRGTEGSNDEPLLMTYDDERTPVATLLRELSETALADIIYQFGGERYSRRIAKAIKERGKRAPIATNGDLAETVRNALPARYEHGRIDPATRTFQALRIYANGELDNLERLLAGIPDIVRPGGRAAIITFHSLEDRMVKQAFRMLAAEGKATLITKKPLPATQKEIVENPRSRSAKLRVIQRS